MLVIGDPFSGTSGRRRIDGELEGGELLGEPRGEAARGATERLSCGGERRMIDAVWPKHGAELRAAAMRLEEERGFRGALTATVEVDLPPSGKERG